MLQRLKMYATPGFLMAVMMMLVVTGCNNAAETEEKSASPAMETPAPEMNVVPDSLPPIDTSASSRPEPRKTIQ